MEKTTSPIDALTIERAYESLLGLSSHSPSRHRIQHVLAGLRDELVKITGHDAEFVQNFCEKVAMRQLTDR